MSDTTYLPFAHVPPEINEAAEKLHVFFERQGMREWQYSHVADRRLVNKLERERNELQDIKRKYEENELRMAHEIDQLRAALLAMHEYYREFTIKGSLYKQVVAALQIVS